MKVQLPKNHRSRAMAILTLISVATASGAVSSAGMDDFTWSKRPVVIFAASETDSRAQSQLRKFGDAQEDLVDREIVVISVLPDSVTGPNAASLNPDELRSRYGVPKGSFAVILIGKDSGVKRRSDAVVDPSEFFDLIDTMPMRRREVRSDN